MNGTVINLLLHFCIAALEKSGLTPEPKQAYLPLTDVRTRSIGPNFVGKNSMSAQDLPATARALSVVVAIALVATALAPLIFTAARVVA